MAWTSLGQVTVTTPGTRVQLTINQSNPAARIGCQSLLVQESFDSAWRASSAGRPAAVRKDALGFLWIDAPPGDQQIDLVFATPLENIVGRVLTGATVILVLLLIVRKDPVV